MTELNNFVFDMGETGRRISNCRQKKNMTQLELADKLNISYQAVSSWERGRSMVYISEFAESSNKHEVSVDYILCNSEQAQIIDKINNGDISDIVKDPNVNFSNIVKIAPLLKPSQLNDLFNEGDYDSNSIGELCGIAQFVSREVLDKLAEKVSEAGSIGELCGIAPFVSREVLDGLAEKVSEAGSIGELCGIAPFVSREVLNNLAEKVSEEGSIGELCGIAQFVSREVLNKLTAKLQVK
jgi:transcriptional regulator with XRE-family HTH domain